VATYIPNADDSTQPTEDKEVETAALEFRTHKAKTLRAVYFPATDLASNRAELPAAADRAGKFFKFDESTGQPVARDFTTTALETGVFGETLLAVDTASEARSLVDVYSKSETVSMLGARNRIINGAMIIAQRGTSFISPAAGAYTLDRWLQLSSNDGAVTITQNSDVPADNEFQSSLRVAVTTADVTIAAGQYSTIRQYIEGYNVRDLIGKTFTLSFRVRSSKTGVHCVAFVNDGGDRSFVCEYTITAANTWETKSVSVVGGLTTAGSWNWTSGRGLVVSFVLAAGATYQTTADAWQAGNFISTVNQVNCLDAVGNIFAITGVQLEKGSVATPFEYRNYGHELLMCQRYFSYAIGSVRGNATAAGQYLCSQVYYPVQMRAVPATSASGGATNLGTVTLHPGSLSSFRLEIQSTGAGDVYSVDRLITLNAEL